MRLEKNRLTLDDLRLDLNEENIARVICKVKGERREYKNTYQNRFLNKNFGKEYLKEVKEATKEEACKLLEEFKDCYYFKNNNYCSYNRFLREIESNWQNQYIIDIIVNILKLAIKDDERLEIIDEYKKQYIEELNKGFLISEIKETSKTKKVSI